MKGEGIGWTGGQNSYFSWFVFPEGGLELKD